MPITFQHVGESILPLVVGVVYALINIHNVKLPSFDVPDSAPTIVILSCVDTLVTRYRSPTASSTTLRFFISSVLTYFVFKIYPLVWIYENVISSYVDGYVLFLLFSLFIFCLMDSIPSLEVNFENKIRNANSTHDSSSQHASDVNSVIGEILLRFISMILFCTFIYYSYQFSSFIYSKYLELREFTDNEYFYENFD